MARDKLITIRIESDRRDAFNQLAKSLNSDTSTILYDFISQCLDGKLDLSLLTRKDSQRLDDNQLDRLDKLELTIQEIANQLDNIAGDNQPSDRFPDNTSIQDIDNRLDNLESTIQIINDRILSLNERISTLESSQHLDMTRQKIDTQLDMTSKQLDDRLDNQIDTQLDMTNEASLVESKLIELMASDKTAIAILKDDSAVTDQQIKIANKHESAKKDEIAIESPLADDFLPKTLTNKQISELTGIEYSLVTRYANGKVSIPPEIANFYQYRLLPEKKGNTKGLWYRIN